MCGDGGGLSQPARHWLSAAWGMFDNAFRLPGHRDACMISCKTALHFCSLIVCPMTYGPSNAERLSKNKM